MKNKKSYTSNYKINNLIGDSGFKQFLFVQSKLGIAIRGGSIINNKNLERRITDDINILSSEENKQIVLKEIIISN